MSLTARSLTTPLVMRSKLFVPASRPELFQKALASDADAISFDLEDAVVPGRREEARAALRAFLDKIGNSTAKTIIVRVNEVGSPDFAKDIAAITVPAVHLINLPKVEDPAMIHAAVAAFGENPRSGAEVQFLVNIETPKALRNATALATSHLRVAGLQIGYADLLEPCGIDRHDTAAVAYVRMAVRMAAAEAGVAAYDGVYAVVKDPAGFQAECIAARRQGFVGKSCIHPSQVAMANAAFTPTEEEIAQATRMIAAAEAAEAEGTGACLVDGHMVDAPFLIRARATLAAARRMQGASRTLGDA
jgi:citrate lyase subunit beta/citryl-CoA lyase